MNTAMVEARFNGSCAVTPKSSAPASRPVAKCTCEPQDENLRLERKKPLDAARRLSSNGIYIKQFRRKHKAVPPFSLGLEALRAPAGV